MLSRCENPSFKDYANYGGRGISVSREFRCSRVFLAWADANGFDRALQIDRIDNKAGYSPANCRFVTQTQNRRNCRNTIRLSDGRSAADVAERNGINRFAMQQRIRYGWSPDDAATLPVQPGKPFRLRKLPGQSVTPDFFETPDQAARRLARHWETRLTLRRAARARANGKLACSAILRRSEIAPKRKKA